MIPAFVLCTDETNHRLGWQHTGQHRLADVLSDSPTFTLAKQVELISYRIPQITEWPCLLCTMLLLHTFGGFMYFHIHCMLHYGVALSVGEWLNVYSMQYLINIIMINLIVEMSSFRSSCGRSAVTCSRTTSLLTFWGSTDPVRQNSREERQLPMASGRSPKDQLQMVTRLSLCQFLQFCHPDEKQYHECQCM